MRFRTSLLLSIAMIGAAQAAHAQTSNMVIMRRALDPKTRTYAWVPGEWSQCSNSCGAGTQTRPVQCMMNGKVGTPEVNCTGERPTDTQSCYDVQACSFSWQPSEWSDVAGCGDVVETRTLSCLRSDGHTVSGDLCPKPAPETAKTVRDLRTCSYSWKSDQWSAWSSECQTAATHTRPVWCERSNGEHVDDASCASSGPKPDTSETADRYGQCGYSWKAGDWSAWNSTCQTAATRTREVTCLRSNGDTVPDAMCGGAGEKPAASETGDQYGSCSYTWKVLDWGAVTPACGASSRSRSVQCLRSNGDVVDDASCNPASKPPVTEAAVDYSTCTYAWNPGAWSAPSSTCGAATETRSVTCLSSDGRTVGDSSCAGAKPDTVKSSYETSGCSYSWLPGSFGAPAPACGATVQTRPVTCLRSDGQTVADGSCDPAKKPSTTQPSTDYSTCTYGWTSTAWGAWSTACGQASQTRTVTCQSSDGRTVADSFCTGTKPDASQSAYQTSGCGYTWTTGSFGAPAAACGSTTQTRSVTCLRSDGQTVADSFCPAGSRPSPTQPATDYSTCTYDWAPGAWGAWSTACGSATQTRGVTCVSSDGRTVADTYCNAATRPATSQSAYQTSGCGYSWNPGTWSAPAAACGATTQTRSVTCLRSDQQTVADSFCPPATRPATSQAATDYSTCSYAWNAGGWSAWSTTCGQGTQTRSVWCQRSDGTTVADTSCASAGTKPDASQSAYQVSGCGYSWQAGGWGAPNAACGASTQYRSVWCQRSDGATVTDAYCGGGKPATSQGATDYSSCTYGWAYGGWSTSSQTCGAINQTRSVWCQRSDGTSVADGYCGGGKPSSTQSITDYSACSYSWANPGAWTDWDNHCSANAYRYRDWGCQRSDGAIVSTTYCDQAGIGHRENQWGAVYDGCGYSVTGWSGYSYASSCSGNTTATQTATGCRRSDGTMVGVDQCASHGVATTQSVQTSNFSGCGYSWQATGWSAQQNVCGTAYQTRSVWCQRSDGATVDGSLCVNAGQGGQPATSSPYTNYNACGYSAVNWSGWSQCSNNSQYHTAQCQRSDGAIVDNSECNNRGIATYGTQGCISACSNPYSLYMSNAWNQRCTGNIHYLTPSEWNELNSRGVSGYIANHPGTKCVGLIDMEPQGNSQADSAGMWAVSSDGGTAGQSSIYNMNGYPYPSVPDYVWTYSGMVGAPGAWAFNVYGACS